MAAIDCGHVCCGDPGDPIHRHVDAAEACHRCGYLAWVAETTCEDCGQRGWHHATCTLAVPPLTDTERAALAEGVYRRARNPGACTAPESIWGPVSQAELEDDPWFAAGEYRTEDWQGQPISIGRGRE
jgi:hypothetical protein